MKKSKKILLALILVTTILILYNKVQAANVGINVSNSNPKVNETVTITVSGTAAQWDLQLMAGGTLLKRDSNTSGVTDSTISFSATYTPTEPGTVNISLEGEYIGENDDTQTKVTGASKTISVKQEENNSNNNSNNSSSSNNNSSDTEEEEEEKSSNANLASLTIGSGTLTPRFSKSTTTYAVTLEDDVTSLTVNAKAEDSKATVDISGNTNLKEGRNPITILVTAEDGTTKTYTINAIKDGTQEEEEEEEETTSSYVKLGLESLNIEGVTLDPSFDPSTYTYNVTIKDDSITSLNVNAIATDENATVEIVGNENLQPGENIVTIIITSENGEDIRVYQIFVTKTTEEVAEVPEENNNMQMWYIIGGSVAGVLILLIIILIVVKKKKSKKLAENKSNKKEESIEIEIENKPVEKKKKTNKKSDKGKH